MAIGNSKNLFVYNFAILLKSQKSRTFYAHEIYMFHSILLYYKASAATYNDDATTVYESRLTWKNYLVTCRDE